MDEAIKDLPGVFVYLDDVLIVSRNQQEHLKHLTSLCQELLHFGLVVNRDKCTFGVQQLKFWGNWVSQQGLAPLLVQVKAIQQFERPQNIEVMQRFWGMINFHRRFVPNAARMVLLFTRAL